MTLRLKTFSAVRWTSAATGVRALLQLTQIVVLARLLTPDDYGLMAIVSVVLGLATIVSDFGLSSAYLQKQDVTPEQRSSLFWFNIATGVALTLLVMALSPMLAAFFNDLRLTPLLILCSLSFVLSTLGQQIRAAAEKSLNFKPLAIVEIISALLALLTAIFTAMAGMGVYALVLGGLTSALANTVLSWMFLTQGWRPMLAIRLADIKPFLEFGIAVTVDGIVNQINLSMDLLLGGRMLGSAQLGLYSVPRNMILQIQSMLNPVITRVSFPLIAQVQHDLSRVQMIYLKTVNMTSSTNAPIYLGLAFFAPEIVYVLLGKNWGASVDLVQTLAIWGLLRSLGNPVGALLLGMGRAGLALKWNIALLCVFPPMLWLGSNFGVDGLARAMLIGTAILFIPGWYLLIRPVCGAGLAEYALSALRPPAIAILAIIPGYSFAQFFDNVHLRLASGVIITTPIYFALNYKLNPDWWHTFWQLISTRRTQTK